MYFCKCTSDRLYDFSNVTVCDHSWGAVEEYDAVCAKSEVRVRVETEEDRREILAGGMPFKKFSGRVLRNDVPRFGLLRNDKLVPGPQVADVAAFEAYDVPFTCVFWRCGMDRRGRILDRVRWRNPISAKAQAWNPKYI